MSLVTFTVGGYSQLALERPSNGTADTAFFYLDHSYTPPNERLAREVFPGLPGQAVKKHGAAPKVVSIQGFIEGSSLANLASARAVVEALAVNQSVGTLVVLGNTISASAIMTALRWGRFWGYGRFCADFELTFESVGG